MPTAELPTPAPLSGPLAALPDALSPEWRQTFGQFTRFALVGCLNTLVDLLALNCLLWLWPVRNTALLLLANSLAYTLGALNSFFLNRYWTFQRTGNVRTGEVLRFALTTLAGIVCNDLLFCFLNSLQHPAWLNPTLQTNLTKIIAIGGTLLISYLGMRLWVFVQPFQELAGPSKSQGSQHRQNKCQTQIRVQEPVYQKQSGEYSLSLVLPAYNEEHIIATTIEQALHILTELTDDFEIIVVNDGSTDQTGTLLAELSKDDPRIHVITHEKNQGYGATLADGFAAATRDLTLFMDSDGQFDLRDLARFLPFCQKYDAVIGYRIARQDTWMRKLNAWGWKTIVYLVLGIQVRDIDCAFKVLHTRFLRTYPLETRGAMINAELLYKLKHAGCAVKEVGVHHLPRQGGRATGANLRVIWHAFRELFLYARQWRKVGHISPSYSYSDSPIFQKEPTMPAQRATPPEQHLLLWEGRSANRPPVQQRLALVAVMLTSIFMNFYQLGQNGFANLFYAAGVRSMADSLHNFFFVSYDPGGFVTIDKPPVGFWLQTLSVKFFGFTPFSIFLPQALAGVLAVLVLFHLVRRHFGYTAGLLAALALAISPLSVATARNNTIDSVLVLTLLLASWAIIRAAETGKWRWLLLSAALVGLGFNVKMLEAYLIVPAFGLLYLLASPRKLRVRVGQLCVAALVLLAVSLSWAIAVDLTPATQRPYVGSSQDNSEINLAFGYNGTERLLGRFGLSASHKATDNAHQATSSEATESGNAAGPDTTRTGKQPTGHLFGTDTPGPLRLFNQALGGQISWLLPFALLGMLALAWQRRPRFQKDYQQQSLLLWGMWVLTMGTFFSVAGFFQQYYMTTFAPAICALFGIGVVIMWQDYQRSDWRGWLLPIALVLTAAEQIHFILSNPAWGIWLIPTIAIPCILTALALSIARLLTHLTLNPRILMSVLALGLAALLLTPAIWSAIPALQNTAPRAPSAGPARQDGFRAFAGATTASTTLLRYLETNRVRTKYLVATPSSMSADAFILATNQPVMALGGFSGRDPILTPGQLDTLISNGTVRFFLLNNPVHQGHAVAFPWFSHNSQTALTTWITHHCATVPAGKWQSTTSNPSGNMLQLYDCADHT